MMRQRYFSPAKLNLFLHITGKRDDGYHNIQSVFCRIDVGDWLTMDDVPVLDDRALDSTALVQLTGAEGLTANLNDNLIIKAAHALHHYSQVHHIGRPKPTHIHLDKNLPTGAGLGGGSSNAATTLIALNQRWQLNLPIATLLSLGASLGADVPFFVADYCHAIAEGIGERLTPMTLPICRYLVVCPPVHSATPAFFADVRLNKASPPISHAQLIQDSAYYTNQLIPPFYNAFETIAQDNSDIKAALDYLHRLSAITHSTPRLTGTGSSVFLPLPSHLTDSTVRTWQKNCPYPTFVAKNY